jgi:hypothetical protein
MDSTHAISLAIDYPQFARRYSSSQHARSGIVDDASAITLVVAPGGRTWPAPVKRLHPDCLVSCPSRPLQLHPIPLIGLITYVHQFVTIAA